MSICGKIEVLGIPREVLNHIYINLYEIEQLIIIRDKYSEEIKLIYFSEINSVDKLYDAEELKQIISNLVALLPDKCREIFMLVKFHALTYKETAEILDLSIKTVETQMGRALKKLKESLLIYFN